MTTDRPSPARLAATTASSLPVSRRRWLQLAAAGAALPAGLLLRPITVLGDEPDRDTAGLAAEIERVMWDKILNAWYPRCLDAENGGFHEDFAEDWTRRPSTSKFLVFQARMTWTPAAVLLAYPDRRDEFAPYVQHGLRFLHRMWDTEHGGFMDRTTVTGQPARERMPWKQLYAYSFGIYAAATAYRATHDAKALELAQAAFRWLDGHAHDPDHGGYYEHLDTDGRPVSLDIPSQEMGRGLPLIGYVGHKSMNAHIHLLEALIALRRVWDDATLSARLEEVFRIVRDKIVRPQGHLAMFCARDFRPTEERSSFGHQLEIAYLLMEAAAVLGQPEDGETRRVARRTVDHSIRWGWDGQHGGFYDEGPPAGEPERRNKVWWVQPEGMNGLLTVSKFADQGTQDYNDYFRRTWRFFCDHLIDHQRGGCYGAVDPAGKLLADNRHKATPWKTAYHVTRAMLLAIEEYNG